MQGRIRDCCIGYAVKGWLTLIWLLIILSGSRAIGQEEPKTDHIKTPTCRVANSKDFRTFGLHYNVSYTDNKPPYELFVESNSDPDILFEQCRAFLRAMVSAQIDEAVTSGKAELAKRKDEHLFLRVAKK